MNCPVELVDKMYPFLPQLRDNFKKFQAANIPAPSVESLIKTFTYLAGVVFQDALEYLRLGQCFDAEKQIRNRPILWLTQQQEFKSEFMHYKLLHDCGVSILSMLKFVPLFCHRLYFLFFYFNFQESVICNLRHRFSIFVILFHQLIALILLF